MKLLFEEKKWVDENLMALLNYYNEFEKASIFFKPHMNNFYYNQKIDHCKIKELLNSIGLEKFEVEIVFTEDLSYLANYGVVEENDFDSNFEINETKITVFIPKSRVFFKDVIDFEILLNICSAKLDIDGMEYRTGIDDGAFRLLNLIALGFSSQLLTCSNREFRVYENDFIRGFNLDLNVTNDLLVYGYLIHFHFFKRDFTQEENLFSDKIRDLILDYKRELGW